jgi:epoxyqueuosine reductase
MPLKTVLPHREFEVKINEQTLKYLEGIFESHEENRLPEGYGGGKIFSAPLIGVASGDDPIFQKYKASEVVGPKHMTPHEMWLASELSDKDDLAASLRVISIVFPYTNEIREEGKNATGMPPEIYCMGRNLANAFINNVLEQTVEFFEDKGFQAVGGMISPAFQINFRDGELGFLYAVWSERHIAFAAGLGTFSLHEGLITEAGCNIRLGSVITVAPLEVTPRKSDDPYANCLHFAGENCMKCVSRCAGKALSEDGHDKVKCYLRGQVVAKEMEQRLGPILKSHHRNIGGRDQKSYPVGCALCQFGVPCTSKNPVKNKRSDD